MAKLSEKLKNLPQKPGVYLFKNDRGEVLYVGKAKNLKNRVRSYFIKNQGHEMRTILMLRQVSDLDYVVVSSELESLILENNLIKQYKPRFNVRMRDDKNYQFIKIDYELEVPQVYTVRKIEKRSRDKARYFGPYTSGLSVRETLKLINRIFHLCRNKKISTKPCFAYHLGRCLGVCIGKISLSDYRQMFKEIEDFLKHKQTEVLARLRQEMAAAARAHKFEKAAAARDKVAALTSLWERQKIVSPKKVDEDYLGFYITNREAVINLFLVREGRLIHSEHFQIHHENSNPGEILENFILRYYLDASDIPKEIFVPHVLPNQLLLEKALRKIKNSGVKIFFPNRGTKTQLLRLASENAKLFYEREQTSFEKNLDQTLVALQSLLNLPTLPQRIEGYDISNIQGSYPVGSMVVFEQGKPAKAQYRKFKIRGKETPDDFAMMHEILTRRFKHNSDVSLRGAKQRSNLKNEIATQPVAARNDLILWPLPDLIVIDGGKGQLGVAKKVLRDHHLQLPVLGLAKRLEEIFVPGRKDSILLDSTSPVLFLLQQIRDEAHRFAITFYRKRHMKSQDGSRLDEIFGVGPTTRKKLMQKFGTISGIRSASLEALAREIGLKKAKTIKENL